MISEVDDTMKKFADGTGASSPVAEIHDKVEGKMHLASKHLKMSVCASAAATCAQSCGPGSSY